jgi:hypothetical protein
LHYFLVEGISQSIIIVGRGLLTEIFLKLENGEVEGLFFFFEIFEIIDFGSILIGDSNAIGKEGTQKRRRARSCGGVFWPWK